MENKSSRNLFLHYQQVKTPAVPYFRILNRIEPQQHLISEFLIEEFSSWTELLQGVRQESVLGPLSFNIYLNDLFFFLDCNVCNFADDSTPLLCNKNLDLVLNELA